jgi:regulator of sigma E protease
VSWLLAFVGFALLIILHELGHFSAAKAVGMRVERFSLFFPPLLARKKYGETEYAIGAIPFGGYVKISGMNPDEDLPDEVRTRAYYSQPVWKRITVIAAGPAVNLVLAFVLMFAYAWIIGERDVSNPPNIGAIERAMPAAGKLKAGDTIESVDGVRGGPDRLAKAIQSHKCAGVPHDGCKASTPATVVVKRDGKDLTFKITPVYDAHPSDDGPPRTRLGFGYAFDGPRVTLGFKDALDNSVDRFGFVTGQTLSLPARLINPQQRKELSGVVGSYEVTRQTILDDLGRVVLVLAVISLSLAIVNLFPFLPLDGGHIFWAIVEKVRRKPVPFSVMERAGVVGFMVVILIFLIGLSNDIGRLSGEGFGVR